MDTYLEHYGRKGMKWYKHIFGESDSRAEYSSRRGSSGSKDSTKRKLTPGEKERILKDSKKLYKNKDQFTTKEIEDAVRRYRAINELERVSNGKKAVNQFFDVMNDVNKKTSTGINFYNNFAKIWNAFSPEDTMDFKVIGQKNKK